MHAYAQPIVAGCRLQQAGTTKDAVQPCQNPEPFHTTPVIPSTTCKGLADVRHSIARGRILVNLFLALARGRGICVDKHQVYRFVRRTGRYSVDDALSGGARSSRYSACSTELEEGEISEGKLSSSRVLGFVTLTAVRIHSSLEKRTVSVETGAVNSPWKSGSNCAL